MQVSSFKYSGKYNIRGWMKYAGNNKKELQQAKTTFVKKKRMFVSKKVHEETKKTFLKTFKWSIALRGSETWIINEKVKRSLEAFEIRRQMEKISWTEKCIK